MRIERAGHRRTTGEAHARASLLLHGVRVLLAHDGPDSLARFAYVLDAYGASVITAADAVRAAETITRQRPDIVVSDFATVSSAAAVGHSARAAGIPAIALMRSEHPWEREAMRLAGFGLRITRPVNGDDLCWELAKLAGRR
jgi:CheY-like chemotaxis protein